MTDSSAHAHIAVELDYNFISVGGNLLHTPAHNFTVHGHPLLVQSASLNKTAVVLNKTAQYIEYSSHTNLHSCIGNILHCTTGFTFTFDLQFLHAPSLTSKTYILSSSGPLNPGIEMYYFNHTFYLSVMTTQIWVLEFPYGFSVETWHKYRIVWSEISGLTLHIDGMNVISEFPVSNVSVALQPLSLFIGSPHNHQANYIPNIMISGMTEIVYVTGKRMYIFLSIKCVKYITFGSGLILLPYFTLKYVIFQKQRLLNQTPSHSTILN